MYGPPPTVTYWLMAGGLPLTEALNPPKIDAFFIWSNTHSVIMPGSRCGAEMREDNERD